MSPMPAKIRQSSPKTCSGVPSSPTAVDDAVLDDDLAVPHAVDVGQDAFDNNGTHSVFYPTSLAALLARGSRLNISRPGISSLSK